MSRDKNLHIICAVLPFVVN